MYKIPPMPTTQNKTRYTETLKDGTSFEMIHIQGGSFEMGNAEEDPMDREQPVHLVSVPSFFLSPFLVTQELWEAVMDNNPSEFQGKRRPVEMVSWNDCQEFLGKLNQETGKSYRLPTESEWEFAACGGTESEGYLYAGSDKLKQVGWYVGNSADGTKPVGLKMPNELGLYDMSGNLWEWCEDDWHDEYRGAPTNGSAWIDQRMVEQENASPSAKNWLKKIFGGAKDVPEPPAQVYERGSDRVLRGGSWSHDARACRVSIRSSYGPEGRYLNIGFRLSCSPQSAGGQPDRD